MFIKYFIRIYTNFKNRIIALRNPNVNQGGSFEKPPPWTPHKTFYWARRLPKQPLRKVVSCS